MWFPCRPEVSTGQSGAAAISLQHEKSPAGANPGRAIEIVVNCGMSR
jgi:hypothetical protein